jgi:serine/threonine-protein kinase
VGGVLAGRYRVDRLIDEGAMGRVYEGHHLLMQKRVAIKVLKKALTRVPEVVARFEREAQAAANIGHEHVAAATDFGRTEDGSVFLVMEYIEGQNLRHAIARGPMDVSRVLHITSQILSALSAAHKLDIVHRDLKPENVMLLAAEKDADFVKVLDFGVAKVPIEVGTGGSGDSQQITRAGMVFGTPDYMAPEQALAQNVDGRADLFSVGVMLFEMLAGVRPYDGGGDLGVLGQQLSQGPPTFQKRVPTLQVPRAVERFVLGLLATEAKTRLPSADAALENVRALIHAERTGMFAAPQPALGKFAEGSAEAWKNLSERMSETGKLVGEKVSETGKLVGEKVSETGKLVSETTKRVGEKVSETGREALSRAPAIPTTRAIWLERAKSVPKKTWAVAGGVLALGLVVALAWPSDSVDPIVVGPKPETSAAPSPSADAPSSELAPEMARDAALEKARQEGLPALAKLTRSYPDDALVWASFAQAQTDAGEFAASVHSVQKSLTLDPKAANLAPNATALKAAAQVNVSSAPAFKLLTGPMEARGAEIVYDLASSTETSMALKQQALLWLTSKRFAQVSTPALAVAGDLLIAKSCEARRGLLLRAKNVGGKRSLALLKEYRAGRGCGADEPTPCNACLVETPLLGQAISELEKRVSSSE